MEQRRPVLIAEKRFSASDRKLPPSEIHLMTVGMWKTPRHGTFDFTPQDFAEIVTNFTSGIALVEGDPTAPINDDHDETTEANGWITSLFTKNNGTELWGNTEWTPKGVQALADKSYKYLSVEVWTRDEPWNDPEDVNVFVGNVLDGCALTNKPLFKRLKPIMASREVAHGVSATSINGNEGEDMDLSELRVKALADLSEEEKAYLAEHQAELSDEERTAFELVETVDADAKAKAEADEAAAKAKEEADAAAQAEADAAAAKAAEEADAAKALEASAFKGITAKEYAQLQADAKAGREAQQELLKTKLTASVKTHVDRGAIKSAHMGEAVELLMASSEGIRERLQTFMDTLPSNELITKGEMGSGADVEGTALAQLNASVDAAIKADPKLTYSQAMKQVISADSKLRQSVDAERAQETK